MAILVFSTKNQSSTLMNVRLKLLDPGSFMNKGCFKSGNLVFCTKKSRIDQKVKV